MLRLDRAWRQSGRGARRCRTTFGVHALLSGHCDGDDELAVISREAEAVRAIFLDTWRLRATLGPMPWPSTAAYSLLERWLEAPVPSLDALARAYVEAAARTRPRPVPMQTRYRFPRGRRTDRVPISAALSGRCR